MAKLSYYFLNSLSLSKRQYVFNSSVPKKKSSRCVGVCVFYSPRLEVSLGFVSAIVASFVVGYLVRRGVEKMGRAISEK
jgi:hypothetical protein